MPRRFIFKFSNKKSTIILRQMLMHLGMISLIAIIYLLLKAYVDSIEQDTEFEMLFLSRDLALLMNTLHSSPGKIEYNYYFDKLDLSKYNFEFGELNTLEDKPVVKVEGYEHEKVYPYGKFHKFQYPNSIRQEKSITFFKDGSKITVNKNE